MQAVLEAALLLGGGAAARRELEIVEAELVDRGGALVDQLRRAAATRRPRRRTAPSGSATLLDVHPDAGDLLLLAHDDRLERALEHDRDVGAGSAADAPPG